MNLKRLQVANLRAFEHAEFDFNPSMTLLVGVNGVGKTTVLDAVQLSLSKILPAATASRTTRTGPYVISQSARAGSAVFNSFFLLERALNVTSAPIFSNASRSHRRPKNYYRSISFRPVISIRVSSSITPICAPKPSTVSVRSRVLPCRTA